MFVRFFAATAWSGEVSQPLTDYLWLNISVAADRIGLTEPNR
jgi:hypothetical protein